jgi:hypothetical protein
MAAFNPSHVKRALTLQRLFQILEPPTQWHQQDVKDTQKACSNAFTIHEFIRRTRNPSKAIKGKWQCHEDGEAKENGTPAC